MRKNDLCKFLAGKVFVCATAMLTTIPVYGNNEADSLSAERRDVKLNSVLVQGGCCKKKAAEGAAAGEKKGGCCKKK